MRIYEKVAAPENSGRKNGLNVSHNSFLIRASHKVWGELSLERAAHATTTAGGFSDGGWPLTRRYRLHHSRLDHGSLGDPDARRKTYAPKEVRFSIMGLIALSAIF
jgi:hypothetical protein